jgi:hypothetical protein
VDGAETPRIASSRNATIVSALAFSSFETAAPEATLSMVAQKKSFSRSGRPLGGTSPESNAFQKGLPSPFQN